MLFGKKNLLRIIFLVKYNDFLITSLEKFLGIFLDIKYSGTSYV